MTHGKQRREYVTGAAANGAGLDFMASNTNGEAVIYFTDDPNLNRLAITLHNTTGQEIRLKSGAPVEVPQPGGPSSFYFYFGALLSNEEVRQIQVAEANWKSATFVSDDGFGPVAFLVVTPTQDRVVVNGDSVVMTLVKFTVSEDARPDSLEIDYYNIAGLADNLYTLPLQPCDPPSNEKHDLREYLICNLDKDYSTVYLTTDEMPMIANELRLILSNSYGQPLLADPDRPPPCFCLSFVFSEAPAYGALTTPEWGSQIRVSILQNYGNDWEVQVQPGEPPCWLFYPQTQTILGTGANASMDIRIDNVVSRMQEGTTLLSFSYCGIKDFNDGCSASQIFKRDPDPAIVKFYADPSDINAGESAKLFWSTQFAYSAELSENDNPGRILCRDPQCPGGFPVPAQQDTRYTLKIFNKDHALLDEKDVSVTVMPRIVHFQADPQVVNFSQGPCTVNLEWQVEGIGTTGRLILDHNIGEVTGKTSYPAQVNAVTTYTLTAGNSEGGKSEARAPIYTVSRKDFPVSGWCVVFALSPDNSKIYAVQGHNLIVIDVKGNKVLATVPFPGSADFFHCICMDMAADGRMLYINPNLLELFGLDTTQVDPHFSLAAVSVHEGECWTQFCVNGTKLYCALVDDAQNHVRIIDTAEPQKSSLVTVGAFPHILLPSPDGARIYVLNFDSGDISVLDAVTDQLIDTIPAIRQGTAMGINPAGTQLYVGEVWGSFLVIDIASKTVLQALNMGTMVNSISVSPDGNSVYLLLFGNNYSEIRAYYPWLNVVRTIYSTNSGIWMIAAGADGKEVYYCDFVGMHALVFHGAD